MAQFLTGIIPVKIGTSRFKKILEPSSNKLSSQIRICKMCTIGEPEDEVHFLCSCTLFISLRKPLFDVAMKCNVDFQSFFNTDKLIWLINNRYRYLVVSCMAKKKQCTFFCEITLYYYVSPL